MSLIEQPEDHKHKIFSYLPLVDLIQLGFASKDLYYSKSRRTWLNQRVVDKHFYQRRSYGNPVKDWSLFIRYFCPYNTFLELYFKRLRKISIQDIEPIFENGTMTKIRVNNNGMFFEYTKRQFQREIQIQSFPLDFIELEDSKYKKEIMMNIFQFMFDSWNYAEKYQQDMDTSFATTYKKDERSYFDLFTLYESLEYFIQKVFIEDKSYRDEIMTYLYQLQEDTKNSREYESVPFRYDYYSFQSNQFNVTRFLCYLDHYEITTDLDKILDIGEYLSKFKDPFLFYYLRERFDCFIDLENINEYDGIMEEFSQLLDNVYENQTTYKEKLFELFTLSNYSIHNEFENCLRYRLKLDRGEINNYDGVYEDYDY